MRESDDNLSTFHQDESLPVDMLAALYEARGWSFEREADDEISAEVRGSWTNYNIRAIWREEDNVLQIIALPGVNVDKDKRANIYKALGLINEQLWIGHFDLWENNGILLFRHALIMSSNGMLGIEQAQTMIDTAIDECERYYPVFQFIIWGGKSPEDAIANALIDTQGEA